MNEPTLPAARPGGLPAVRVEHHDAATALPAVVEVAGGNARFAYEEFLAGIDSPNTLRAYRHALHRFMEHVDGLGLGLQQVTPKLVSAYLRQLKAEVRVKQGEPARFEEASKAQEEAAPGDASEVFDLAVERHALVGRVGSRKRCCDAAAELPGRARLSKPSTSTSCKTKPPRPRPSPFSKLPA